MRACLHYSSTRVRQKNGRALAAARKARDTGPRVALAGAGGGWRRAAACFGGKQPPRHHPSTPQTHHLDTIIWTNSCGRRVEEGQAEAAEAEELQEVA